MDVFVIGDRDTVLGFRLAGTRGHVVSGRDDAVRALDGALRNATTGLVLVTEPVAATIRDEIDGHGARAGIPLILEIPDGAGPRPGRISMDDLVRKAIGVST